MVANVIRNEIPADASTSEVIAVLSRQRMRARRGNEARRELKALDNPFDNPGEDSAENPSANSSANSSDIDADNRADSHERD